MRILYVQALRGPNQWTHAPVIESWVDLGEWKDRPSDSIPGFNQRLYAWLPGLIEHRCSIGERGGFLERLRRGTYLAHILEHVTLELHGLAGVDIYYGRARETVRDGVYKVVFKYKEETLGRECLAAARDLCMAAVEDRPFDMAATMAHLRAVAVAHLLDPDTQAIVDAAARRNIPAIRLGRSQFVQLGYGVRQRRIRGTQTDRARAIAANLPLDRELVQEQLQAAGVPVELTSDDGPPSNGLRLLVAGGRMIAASQAGAVDVTGQLHPAIAERAVEAAAALDWDVAGIDIRAQDIQQPLEGQGGAVVGLSPSPALTSHLKPAEGQPRPVADEMVNLLFAPGDEGRIPILAVTGTNGKTTVTRFIAHILQATGKRVGMTCTDGVYLDGRRITRGDCSGPASARQILMHPRAEVAVLETARGGILRAGLAFDRCQVAVVTNVGAGDHLGTWEVYDADHLARVKRVIVEVVAPDGTVVLNAADPLVAAMAEKCPGRVLYFARDGTNTAIAQHRAAGGRAVFERNGMAVLAEGEREETLLALDRIPMTMGGRIGFQVENALAAFGAAWALGVPRETIAAEAAGFASDLEHDPTRFNAFEIGGATVIVDFGHNADALQAVIEALGTFPQRKRSAVFSSSGDRREEDIVRMGQLLGDAFDRVVVYEDDDRFERPPGETIALLRRGMAAGGRVRTIEEVEGGLAALRYAVETVEPGELLLAQAHMADPTVEYLRSRAGAIRPLALPER